MALFHPLNDHYGMSPLEPAGAGIDLHNAAGAWNKALLDNSACPSGALVYTAKDGALSPEQYDRLKGELDESFQGARNAGRPLLLESDFLTLNEKRGAVGYGAVEGGDRLSGVSPEG